MLIIDNGRSNARKMLYLNQCTLNENQKNALVGLHAMSSCDKNSSFFRKGKKGASRLPRNISMFFVNLVYPIKF